MISSIQKTNTDAIKKIFDELQTTTLTLINRKKELSVITFTYYDNKPSTNSSAHMFEDGWIVLRQIIVQRTWE